MRELLEAVAAGEITPAEAEAELAGYVTGEAGRFDVERDERRGIPEAILAEGKEPAEIADLAGTAIEATDRALVTRIDDETLESVEATLRETVSSLSVERFGIAARFASADYDPHALEATVAIVTGGTADRRVAAEAALVCEDGGCTVDRIEDVGVASIARVLDQRDRLRAADVVIVAAGREASLASVVAGLVDAPVIGLPVSSGYGHWGDGRAALAGMLQSCTVLSVVNVDAGYVAGAQATLIARAAKNNY